MVVKKIDNNRILCCLSNQELKQVGITEEDYLEHPSTKLKNLVTEIINEVGPRFFNNHDSVQIRVMPGKNKSLNIEMENMGKLEKFQNYELIDEEYDSDDEYDPDDEYDSDDEYSDDSDYDDQEEDSNQTKQTNIAIYMKHLNTLPTIVNFLKNVCTDNGLLKHNNMYCLYFEVPDDFNAFQIFEMCDSYKMLDDMKLACLIEHAEIISKGIIQKMVKPSKKNPV